jgi:DNA polymerase-1
VEPRVHCSLNLNTETGRLSARRPNLQNQPSLDRDKFKIRAAFKAGAGRKLVVADYGQLELRVLAHLAQCTSMVDAFAAGGDFHSRTAMGMYAYVRQAVDRGEVLLEWDEHKGVAPAPLLKDKFKEERRKAKILNFSIAYGKTAFGLAKDWQISFEEAERTVELWYGDRPEVREWQQRTKEGARRTRRVHTILGRHRNLPDINTRTLKAHNERAAINTPIQGSAADIVMCAMLKAWRSEELAALGFRMLLQVHDEIILEGPEAAAPAAMAALVRIMERPFDRPLLVDLVVDAKVVSSWGDAK